MNITQSDKDYLKGYAVAIQQVMTKLTGDNTCAKWYDPIGFEEEDIRSYAFNFKNGSRRHPLKDFKNKEEIVSCMLCEGIDFIKSNE